jgi:hypothetical protein
MGQEATVPKVRRKRRKPLKATVTLPLEEYQQMRALAIAGRRAFDALNEDVVSQENVNSVVWSLWRAVEGNVPPDLH